MKKQRVEDLGRIRTMLENILEDEMFNLNGCYLGCSRNKDCYEAFSGLVEEAKEDFIRKVIYGMNGIEDKLIEILSIAIGEENEGEGDV